MPVRIAINGFGRIGRASFKAALQNKNVVIVAINDLMDTKTLAHLLKYDSVYGEFKRQISAEKDGIKVDKVLYTVLAEKDPTKLPWKKFSVDVVIESTGRFTNKEEASAHITAGAKRVVISAPAKDDVTQTLVFGTALTADVLKKGTSERVVSNASCTTNCISPVIQVLESAFGIEKAMMTTVHSYTADQSLVDGPHRDLRRARAAAHNIIPTTTGAAIATTQVVPSLKNLFDGISIRVPTICASLSDITAIVKKNVTEDDVRNAFKATAKNPLYKNVLAVTEEQLVSSDFIGNPYSAVVDLGFTRVIGGNFVKVLAWYDNEWGYSLRLVDMAEQIGKVASVR